MPSSYGYQPSMIDLILNRGRIAAEGAQQSGDIWGRTVSGLGQIATGAIQQYGEQQQLTKRAQAFQRAIESGDPKTIIGVLGPKDGPPVITALNAHKPDGLKAYSDKATLYRDQARGILGVPEQLRAGAYDFARNSLIKQGVSTPDELPDNFAQAEPLIRQYAAYGQEPRTPKLRDVAAGASVIDESDPGKILVTAPGKEAPAPNLQHIETAEGIRSFNPQTGEVGPVVAKSKPSDAVLEPPLNLTHSGLDMAALNYRKTGLLPPMGMSKSSGGMKQAIINRAAAMTPDDIATIEAGGLDLAGNKASYGADTKSLAKIQQQSDAVTAFETTAHANAKVLDGFLKKLPDAGVKFLNAPLRAVANQLGSEDQAAVNILLKSLQSEYGRIIQNPNLSGVMSDTARREAEQMIAGDATVGQIRRALATLAQEAGNRRQGFQGQLQDIRGRMGGGKKPAGGPRQISSDAEFDALPSGTTFIDPEGNPRIKP